jgi:hypothetical protein
LSVDSVIKRRADEILRTAESAISIQAMRVSIEELRREESDLELDDRGARRVIERLGRLGVTLGRRVRLVRKVGAESQRSRHHLRSRDCSDRFPLRFRGRPT